MPMHVEVLCVGTKLSDTRLLVVTDDIFIHISGSPEFLYETDLKCIPTPLRYSE